MNRREFCLAVSGAATIGGAGCLGAPGTGTSGVANTPEAAVEQYFRALDDGDRAGRRAVLHSENPERARLAETTDEDLVAMADAIKIQIEEVTVIERADEQAVVSATILLSTEQGTESITDGVELRTEDGRWKIYGEATVRREIDAEVPEDPRGVVVQYFQAVDINDIDRIRRLIHTESPLARRGTLDVETISRTNATVLEVTVVEEGETRAIVVVDVRIVSGGSVSMQSSRIELRRENGEWRLWADE